MRALLVLQDQLESSLVQIHKKQRDAIWRSVAGLIIGGKLWLTALGRSLPGSTSDKHRIKAVNRLLGKESIHRQLPLFYRALAARLLKLTWQPVLVIDWTGLGPYHYALSAQLCSDGRTMPLYNRVFPKRRLSDPIAQREFLHDLAVILPSGCKPVILTDAGFRSPWFDAVASCGWDFVGRVRHRTKVFLKQSCIAANQLYGMAGSQPRDLGTLTMRRVKPRRYRLVLSARPILKGRKRMTRRGRAGRNTTDVKCSSGARQPWLLATSLTCGAKAVVSLYKLRMQIEQSFRDAKNFRHGWAMHHVRSKSAKRLEVLLLIAALAFVVLHAIGRAATRCGARRHFQANTLTRRRVLSFFVLARHVLRSGTTLPLHYLAHAFDEVAETIRSNTVLLQRE